MPLIDRHPGPRTDEMPGVLGSRFEALFLDALVVVAVVFVFGYVAGTLIGLSGGGGLSGVIAVVFGSPVVLLLYQTVFEGYYGRTVGKAARGLVVVTEDGEPVSWSGAILRNVLRLIDALPALYIIGIVAAFVSDHNQRLGDIVGSTVVAYTAD